MTVDAFFGFTFVVVLAIFSPGPSFIGVTQYFFKYGPQRSLAFNAGICAGESVLSGIVLFGVINIFFAHPLILPFFYGSSGCYLALLGYQQLRQGVWTMEHSQNKLAISLPSYSQSWLSGFSIGIANPKSMIADMAIFANFIPPDTPLWQKASIWIWCFALSFFCFTLLCWLYKKFRDQLTQKLFYIQKICGAFLFFLGLRLIWNSLNF